MIVNLADSISRIEAYLAYLSDAIELSQPTPKYRKQSRQKGGNKSRKLPTVQVSTVTVNGVDIFRKSVGYHLNYLGLRVQKRFDLGRVDTLPLEYVEALILDIQRQWDLGIGTTYNHDGKQIWREGYNAATAAKHRIRDNLDPIYMRAS